jgi:uncharacterized membrane protein
MDKQWTLEEPVVWEYMYIYINIYQYLLFLSKNIIIFVKKYNALVVAILLLKMSVCLSARLKHEAKLKNLTKIIKNKFVWAV